VSQRPFLTNADYYRRTLAANFTIDSRTMIEDKMHSVAASNPWAKNRIAIYHPETGTSSAPSTSTGGEIPRSTR